MQAGRILIIGGGASGVLLAAQLLRVDTDKVAVTIIERRAEIGAGIAYSTDHPDHLLNTRTAGMSAFPDDPDHFLRWLHDNSQDHTQDLLDPGGFVPRRLYRDYLRGLLDPWANRSDGRLRVVHGQCVRLENTPRAIRAILADGSVEEADVAVLATGHAEPQHASGARISGPWCSADELSIAPDDAVLILGTGLSMVDNVALLRNRGHRGPITAVSRRGLLPRVHALTATIQIEVADVPFGARLSELTRWLRHAARSASEHGGDWRGIVDALRPHMGALWQSMPVETRRRFLRHGRTFWEVHRHRMAPQAARMIRDAMASGQLRVVAGRIHPGSLAGHGSRVTLTERGGETRTFPADRIIDCTGILRDPTTSSGHLVAELIQEGRARLDPLGIGIDVHEDGSVLDYAGTPSSRLFAVGPVTRARFWEITAVPDIRVQCGKLAATFVEGVRTSRSRSAANPSSNA
ncbi:FAD/NAD(P)-binding protein [Aureimonas jatrophae]|uniref:Uncharacterized NAD(P)/FAD-binding protein YdhS n=1 Tax=Aureimonas jatrophae TaxID=1166073 RepID=A0A1H0ML38_9HYPH|nr:FAD/NAD(P)-binding protein [Aureimonas jatrophae]MBB3952907.1 putative NAD(P)/FAD-binding protein YdhS [Aureimonas jatrophae]SDO81025.1 Uncharacterized NAD(P)/FAD-binding protein YdhS [Aureimonas jatrophae]